MCLKLAWTAWANLRALRLVLAGALAMAGTMGWAQGIMDDTFENLHVSAEIPPDPHAGGWQVNPRLGQLSVTIPIGMMPGEVSFPISLNITGLPSVHTVNALLDQWERQIGNGDNNMFHTYSDYGTINYNRAPSSVFNLGFVDKSSGASVYRLEDGRVYDDYSFVGSSSLPVTRSLGVDQSALFTAYGFPVPADFAQGKKPYHVSSDGRMLMYATTVLDPQLAATALGTKFTTILTAAMPGYTDPPERGGFVIFMDKDRARIFQTIAGNLFPLLIADRFNHYVTLKWSLTSDMTRVDVLNQRGQGFTIRQARSALGQDLACLDFVNMSGPSVLVQGNRPAPISTYHYDYNDGYYTVKLSASPAYQVQSVGTPTTVTLGAPSMVPQPVWSNAYGSPSAPPAPPGTQDPCQPAPPVKTWNFEYDPIQGGLKSMTDPLGLKSSFTTTTYSVVQPRYPNATAPLSDTVTGVVQVDQSDHSGHSSTTRTLTWSRQLTGNAISVTHKDTWGPSTTPDRALVYGYGDISNSASPLNNATDYGNGFLTSLAQVDLAGTALATLTRQSLTTPAGAGGGLYGDLSLVQTMTATRTGEAQLQAITSYDSNQMQVMGVQNKAAGVEYQSTTYTYNPRWDMLEGGQVATVVSLRSDSAGHALDPITTTNAWDPTTSLLQLMNTSRGAAAGFQHGSQYTYDADGRLQTQGVYHMEAGAVSASLRTLAIGYDDGVTGLPTTWTASYQEAGGGNVSIQKSQGSFDCGFRPTLISNELHVNTTMAYDLYGRVTRIAKVGEAEIAVSYPDFCTKVATQTNKTTTETTDGFGRRISQVLSVGGANVRTTVPTYDLHNRVLGITETPALGGARTSASTYDLLDRVTSRTAFDGKYTTYDYAANGTLNGVTTTLPNLVPSLKTIIQTDPFGQAVSVQAPNGDLTQTAFDSWGNKTSITTIPANGDPYQVRSYIYDALGRMTNKWEPETGWQRFSGFNALNLATTFTEGDGTASPRVRQRVYDGLGRLRSQTNGATTETFTYSGALLTGTSRGVGGDAVTQAFTYFGPEAGSRLQQETTTSSVTGLW